MTTGDSETAKLTILTTEQYTLQSARQLCLQDMQGRATMFFNVVSASLVVIGFFGSASHFGNSFSIFILALLTGLWVLGFLTYIRVIQAAMEDVIISFGLARIRHRYLDMQPALREVFVRSTNDDYTGINREMGSTQAWWQPLMATHIVIAFATSVIAGMEISFALNQIVHVPVAGDVIVGAAAFAANLAAFAAYDEMFSETSIVSFRRAIRQRIEISRGRFALRTPRCPRTDALRPLRRLSSGQP